jgi:sortase (surface protein transpeptidase)
VLDIPAIDVSTPLVRLGLEPDRTVEVPSDPDRAGWFRRGPPPGRPGSSVILGHVDSVDGPAVFARLAELRPGESVTVTRADGSVVRFVVLKTATYTHAEFPADRVYAARGLRRLNLITCGGSYDAELGGYQANVVVYTRRDGAATR